ncbi:MAG: alanine--tRNA ligase, partial [Candidatus Zixiibacteriota bacterium]
MKSYDIRQAFLDYFEGNDHRIIPSSPVVPADDPTLLFTNAGMVQFKNIFLGLEKTDYKRAASSQKCIRAGGKHNDLDNVGFTARHQTFFEMLGNFSFGDYFKEEAIYFAWEFLTKTLGLNPKHLYATVYTDDDEADKLWRRVAPELGDRVLRFGEKDNFWAMGDTGPCGPCSEVHYDRGEHIQGELNGEGDRFMEIWNLVFMQYNRDEGGNITPLPKPSVDTGAGLERFCMIMQNADSNYGTDLFTPLIDKVCKLSEKPYDPGPAGIPHRVIADHIRALSFAIADNAVISNEGRGYVLRRILRRAARYGHQLGLTEPFLYKIVQTLVENMGNVYPELKAQRGHIELVIKTEEEQFDRTLDIGIARFEDIILKVNASGGKVIPGEDVFKLYDTYGFPADLTEIMAHEKGLSIDWDGFNKELEKQRQRSKKTSVVGRILFEGALGMLPKSLFDYNNEKINTKIKYYGKFNDQEYLVLEETPFYAESGGQVGDTGIIESENLRFIVDNTQKDRESILHYGRFEYPEKSFSLEHIFEKLVTAKIDSARRADIQRNHTATHLLHKALKLVLGEHVNQSGSLVAPDHLRFDFSHFKAMTPDEIDEVEKIVNEKIKEDLPISWRYYKFEEAKKMGAVALFGEKYGDTVRVVKTGDFTMELCGGTHVTHTADIGQFFIKSESAIAAGMRRIEAITG